tara:strand:- start:601 stop:996 length:396 start_codon:yes stop_codon:yes gene_type:complete
MKKVLLVLVLALGLTSCEQNDNLGVGQFDGEYKRVSYSVKQDNGYYVLYPQATDGTQVEVGLVIEDGVWTWIYNACECPNYDVPYDEEVGQIIGNEMFQNDELQYTIDYSNNGDIKVSYIDGVAFETFTKI